MGEMILRDDKGRSWKVQLNKNGKNRFYLGCGFRDFCVANGLRKGDLYKFELVENEMDKPPIYLPSKLATTNGLLNKEEMIPKNDDERSWTMGIKRERNYCYIVRGWKEFCAANGLKKGDRIKLELLSNGEIPVVKFKGPLVQLTRLVFPDG
ncbi:putative transcription factor B3-Domain family [Helianthus annuus]|nr:putative transcription factor B3-Domain family [Helianthus annuus]